MLKPRSVATRLPAQDLNRAKAFYADKLGLEPSEERPGGLLYRCAGGEFALFQSAGASPGELHPDGVGRSMTSRRQSPSYAGAAVIFEEYDLPGAGHGERVSAEIAGNYPSKGSGERGAWFRDSEGNMLGIGQPIP